MSDTVVESRLLFGPSRTRCRYLDSKSRILYHILKGGNRVGACDAMRAVCVPFLRFWNVDKVKGVNNESISAFSPSLHDRPEQISASGPTPAMRSPDVVAMQMMRTLTIASITRGSPSGSSTTKAAKS